MPSLLAAVILGMIHLATANPVPNQVTTEVVYVSGSTVYLDAGRDAGLAPGLRVEIRRDQELIALVTVANVSSKRASCVLADRSPEVRVGDRAHFYPEATEPDPAEAAVPATAIGSSRSTSQSWLRSSGLRGAVSLRYLGLSDHSGAGEQYSQPALNFRVTGNRVGGSVLSMHVDVRTRRTYRTRTDGSSSTDNRNRVYRLQLAADVAPQVFVAAGRQVSPDLATVSVFDGVRAEYRRATWRAGAFVGTQPDMETYGYDTGTFEFGGFATLSSAPRALMKWAGTGGFVSSSVDGVPNRDFLFFRGRLSSPRVSGYIAQEIDINTGWKAEAGENTISPTSTVFTAQYRLEPVTLRLGFDNRRNIRLVRDLETPETDFDDTYRLGWSANGDWRVNPWAQVGLAYRTYDGTSDGTSNSLTGRFRLIRLTPWGLAFRGRTTRYRSPSTDGWLYSLGGSGSLLRRHQLELRAGVRDEDRTEIETVHEVTRWYGTSLDMNIGRGWFVHVSYEVTRGTRENNDQTYTSVSYRF